MIFGTINVKVKDISQDRRLRMITFEKTMIISDITKNESNNCFVMHCLQLTTNTPSHGAPQFDIALGNHALCAQPATYGLVSYLLEDN